MPLRYYYAADIAIIAATLMLPCCHYAMLLPPPYAAEIIFAYAFAAYYCCLCYAMMPLRCRYAIYAAAAISAMLLRDAAAATLRCFISAIIIVSLRHKMLIILIRYATQDVADFSLYFAFDTRC